MKKLLQKIKNWFILRWKEFQSIQRDKKAMKTEREVRKVEFSKKHPVYTIATRVIAVLAAMAVAIGFVCVSCQTLKDIENQSTVSASAETFPEESSGISAYALQDVPQFIEIEIPYVPFNGSVETSLIYSYVQYLYFPRLVIDIQGCSIYRWSTPIFDEGQFVSTFVQYQDISAAPISIWYDDGSYSRFTDIFTLERTEIEYIGSEPYSIDTFYYLDVTWNLIPSSNSYSFVISLHGNGGIRHYYLSFNVSTVGDITFNPYFLFFDSIEDDLLFGSNSQYVFYDYLSKSYYNEGYREGDSVGYNRGYNEGNENGFNDGYSLGLLEGENRGYQIGYSEGDAAGYNRGLSETLGDVTPWEVIVDGVNKFFGLSILGNSVTIGMIMSIGFGCILFGFAIKIFLGG